MERLLVKKMAKKLSVITIFAWLISLAVWQLLFYSHKVVSEILWEIHTIFSSVLVFYTMLNLIVKETTLDIIKITFKIIFKVWLIIFIAFSMQNSFNQKAFVLTTTFIFGYLEGLIELNVWLRNFSFRFQSKLFQNATSRFDITLLSIICISLVHILCAFVALVFFNIK